jgi:hypothetical protein
MTKPPESGAGEVLVGGRIDVIGRPCGTVGLARAVGYHVGMDQNPYQSPDSPPPAEPLTTGRSSLLATIMWLVFIFTLPVVTAIETITYVLHRLLSTQH